MVRHDEGELIKEASPHTNGQLVVGVDLRCLQDRFGSGVATYTRLMLRAIKESPDHGFQWQIFTSGAKRPPDFSAILPDCHYRHLSIPNKILNVTMAALNRPRVNYCFPGADLIWQPNPLFLSSSNLPLFVTMHDISFVHFPQFFSPRTRLWYLKWVRRWLEHAPSNAHLLAVSRHTRDDILNHFPKWQGRVTIAPPPLPPELNDDDEAAHIKNIYGLERPFILGLGTIEPRKNINSLILAYQNFVKYYPDFDLVLAGHCQRSAKSAIFGMINESSARLHLLGYIPAKHKEAIYRAAFCLVYPSYFEGFGYPPLEAMSGGTPVIASAVTSLPEVLGAGAIFIDPYRGAEEITAALQTLASDSSVYRHYQEAGKERAAFLRRQFTLAPLFNLWRG